MNRALVLVLAIFIACKQAPTQETKPGSATGPQLAATVIAVRTTIGDKSTNHEVVIANGRARSTNEADVWRLFDTKANTVTFVDDVEKTIRVEPLETILTNRRATLAGTLPSHYPQATIKRGGTKPILGVNATQHVITAGAYRRELWIAEHRAVPEELFAMMHASDAPSSARMMPMVRDVEEELLRAKGFPLVDRTELPYGKKKMVVERTVTGIASRQVPEAMLTIPREYRDVTPKPAPAPAASR